MRYLYLAAMLVAVPCRAQVARQNGGVPTTISPNTVNVSTLSVSQQLNVAGSSFTVSSSGIVSAPSQLHIDSNNCTGNAGNGGYAPIYCGTDANNTGIIHSVSSSSDTYTIPAGGGGSYLAICQVIYNTSATAGVGRYAAVLVNGTALQPAAIVPTVGAANGTAPLATAIAFLSAGDVVKCASRADVAGLTLIGGGLQLHKLW